MCGLMLASLCFSVMSSSVRADEWKSRSGLKRNGGSVRPPAAARAAFQTSSYDDNSSEKARAGTDVKPDRLMGTQPETPIEVPGETTFSDGSVSAESLAASARPSLEEAIDRGSCATDSSEPMTWSQYYACRMNALLDGNAASGDDSFGGWWHGNSLTFQFRNQHIPGEVGRMLSSREARMESSGRDRPVQAAAGKIKNSVSNFIADHTLPPQDIPENDVYDSEPRAIAMGRVRTASDEVSTPDSRIARLTRDITAIQPTLNYALKGIDNDQLPADFFDKLDNGEYVQRKGSPVVMQWAPTNLWHHPLYFEDPALERYGHTYHPLVQPFASTGRFATQLVGLPYQMTLHPVHAKEYTLGWYRPGDCAPKKLYQIPFNEEAALMQAAVLSGLFLIIP